MKEHSLKLRQPYYADVESGKKTFEIRKVDRNYEVGDVLILEEVACAADLSYRFTGRNLLRRIVYVTDFMQRAGYVVLGIEPYCGDYKADSEPMKTIDEVTAYDSSADKV
ncbi:DUF3850 domain-containing protein [Lysinibacillus sp. BF-4]|uniref:DUF3850 domain-containing protein n=1 Tax=Lysinibacillus sp. BF-4 TaxID=1473546 RepID=UPI0009DDE353|nr:DUF3850 domain-containing protein [Lysinibacillus sp. BF-4]